MTVYKGNDFSVERTEKEIINPNPFHYIYIVFRKHTHMNNVRVHIKLYRLLDSSHCTVYKNGVSNNSLSILTNKEYEKVN